MFRRLFSALTSCNSSDMTTVFLVPRKYSKALILFSYAVNPRKWWRTPYAWFQKTWALLGVQSTAGF